MMTNFLSVGSHQITARLSGDSNYLAADSLPVTQQITGQLPVARSIPPILLDNDED